jgi:hypothetical protein
MKLSGGISLLHEILIPQCFYIVGELLAVHYATILEVRLILSLLLLTGAECNKPLA